MNGTVLLANKCEQFEVLHQYHGSSIPSLWHEYIHINIFKTITKFCSSQAWYAMHSTYMHNCEFINFFLCLNCFSTHILLVKDEHLVSRWRHRINLPWKKMISCQLWTCIDEFNLKYIIHMYTELYGVQKIWILVHITMIGTSIILKNIGSQSRAKVL